MTRARNKLIMVGSCKDTESLMEYSPRPKSYLKVLNEVLRTPENKLIITPMIRQGSLPGMRKKTDWMACAQSPLSEEESMAYAEIERRFSYEYTDKEQLTAKAKYSVSAVRREELEAEEAAGSEDTETQVVTKDDEPVLLWNINESRKRASAADIGIAYHRIMEFLDFGCVILEDGSIDAEYIAERTAWLTEHGAITEKVIRDVDLDKIAGFFAGDLGRRAAAAAKAGKLRREKPFTLRTKRHGKEMLVQGVIDCCFEEAGKMILVDYKSSFIRPGKSFEEETERIRHEYAVQIELYAEAASKGTGLEVSEAYLYLFGPGKAVRMI
jgi:ATP-dependent helicase/nuclease subunit A